MEMVKDLGFGIVDFDGKKYSLEQQAYIDGIQDRELYYKASALDAEGNKCVVVWDVVDNWEQIEDEQEMCDWESPISIERI